MLFEPGVNPRRRDPCALEVAGISARYGPLEVLNDVGFRVPYGGVTAVVGPNGSGKTTLLDCIQGLQPCAGSVSMDGWDIGRLRPHRRVALGLARSFQTPTMVPAFDVLTNIAIGAHHWKLASRECAAAALEAAERLDLVPLLQRRLSSLNHAERRLVEIARAFLTRPRVIMLDEPAAGFSHAEGLAVCRLIIDAAHELGCAVLLVEHDVPLVMALAEHVIVLHNGGVLAQGPPHVVQQDPRVVEAYLGTPRDRASSP